MTEKDTNRKKCSSCGKILKDSEAIPLDKVFLCKECFEIVEMSRDTH